MNERIRELLKQATKEVDPHDRVWVFSKVDQAKFAESLIRECARIARATPCPYEEDEVRQRLGHTWDMASLEAGREIVKHFGIAE